MNWLKENWFRLSVIVILLLIAFSFFYYYVIFLIQKEQLTKEGAVLKECGEVAQRNYKAFQEEWNRTHNTEDYSHFSEITTHFNTRLTQLT